MGEVNQDTILQHQKTQNKKNKKKKKKKTSSYYSYSNICNT